MLEQMQEMLHQSSNAIAGNNNASSSETAANQTASVSASASAPAAPVAPVVAGAASAPDAAAYQTPLQRAQAAVGNADSWANGAAEQEASRFSARLEALEQQSRLTQEDTERQLAGALEAMRAEEAAKAYVQEIRIEQLTRRVVEVYEYVSRARPPPTPVHLDTISRTVAAY